MPKKLNATLYHNIFSPPSRMAYLTVKNLDIDIEIHDLDLHAGEQNKPEFLKLNPMHQVPTLVHDDFIVTEARAIMIYLATVAESPLYTLKDIRKKTLIESRLFFDATNASLAVRNFIFPIVRKGVKNVSPIHREALKTLLQNLEILLQNSEYFVGNELTIADFGFLANVATIKALGANLNEYPKLNAWYERCSKLPGAKENELGAKLVAEKVRSLLDEPTWI